MQPILAAKSAIGYVLNQIAGLAKSLKYGASAVTHTARMATRLPPTGPFAAALVVQGKLGASNANDFISLTPGTAISGYFYPKIDMYQGTVVLWITLEWNGNDGLVHRFFREYQQGSFNVTKWSDNKIYFFFAGGGGSTSVSTESWLAGNTYCLVCRWDTKNTLDGTNYMCVSVDDVHTFSTTSAPQAGLVTGINIGANTTTQEPANALIQGLTIYRRPLFDGAYGCDVGNGDEINLIYNAGSGTDPTEITGSFDVCLCVPTNATPGALTTGSTDAWSMPHGSELLIDAFCQRAYASSAWADVGTPVTPVSCAFNGTSTSIDCGSEASVDNLQDAAFTAEAWINASGWGMNSQGVIFTKCGGTFNNSWIFRLVAGLGLRARVYCATTIADAYLSNTLFSPDNKWHHVVMVFDDAGDRKPYIAIDGIWQVASTTAGVGAVVDDAANSLTFGAMNNFYFAGRIGWGRISSTVRYTPSTDFTPPPRGICPAGDANTVRLFPMNEGTGTTITDLSSNAQNGTLSNGTWKTVRDMATDEPGSRIYNWGYDFSADAANEGITQTLSGRAAGTDMVIRPVLHYTPSAIPKVQVLDATNADAVITSMTLPDQTANLVLNGGFDSDTGNWTAGNLATLSSEAGGISGNCLKVLNGAAAAGYAYQVIQLAPLATYRLTWWHLNGTAQGKVSIGTAAGGTTLYNGSNTNDAAWAQKTTTFTTGATGLVYVNVWQGSATNAQYTYFDSITLTRVISATKPWCEPFSFELPTVARNGVAADCTSIKVQVIDTAGLGGVTSVHQVELLSNLIDNPSLNAIAGDPGIPAGWTNSGLGAGETAAESTITHSTGKSLAFLTWPGFAKTFQNKVISHPSYYAAGVWCLGDGTRDLFVGDGTAYGTVQRSISVGYWASGNTAAWHHTKRILRTISAGTHTFDLGNRTGAVGTRYVDDYYAIALDPVTLTCTPASTANSTETTGLRNDGRDTSVQTVAAADGVLATTFTVKTGITPRHSAAVVAKFGELTPYWFHLWGDATNYVAVYWSAANTLKLEYNAGGAGVQSQTWDATAAIVAGTTYALEVAATPTGMVLKIGDVTKTTITAAVNFSTVPTVIYWGSKQDGSCVADATFSPPA
jgi:hypothetical protein